MAQVAPSILAADFARLSEQIAAVEAGGAEMIHVDVMDGRFVPNISMGPPVLRSVRSATKLFLDVHLMIEDPDRYVPDFAAAGAQRLTVHQETCPHLHRSLQLIRDQGVRAGVVVNPSTPVETLTHVLEMVDLVLVMSVNPGFGGQAFLPLAYQKIRSLVQMRAERDLPFLIEVDGGVGMDNAADLVLAGADVLVAGSSIFGTQDPAQAVRDMTARIEQASMLRA